MKKALLITLFFGFSCKETAEEKSRKLHIKFYEYKIRQYQDSAKAAGAFYKYYRDEFLDTAAYKNSEIYQAEIERELDYWSGREFDFEYKVRQYKDKMKRIK